MINHGWIIAVNAIKVILLLFPWLMTTHGEVELPACQHLSSVRYSASLRVSPESPKEIQNYILGWRTTLDQRASLIEAIRRITCCKADRGVTGELILSRTPEQQKSFQHEEIRRLRELLQDLVATRQTKVSHLGVNSIVDQMMAKGNPSVGDTLSAPELNSVFDFLPATGLLCEVLNHLSDRDLEPLLKNQSITLSTQPMGHQFKLSLGTPNELEAYHNAQLEFSRQSLSVHWPESLRQTLSYWLPSRLPLSGEHDGILVLETICDKIVPILTVFGPDGSFESSSSLQGATTNLASAIPWAEKEPEDSGSWHKLSERILHHFSARLPTQLDNHGGRSDPTEFVKDPAAVLVDPANADPLSFEVEEALDKLAAFKGASGWVANCPDTAFTALTMSNLRGHIHLPTFETLLKTQGNCKLEINNGLLEISPASPIRADRERLDREALRRLVKSFKPNRPLPLTSLCDYSSSEYRTLNNGLGNLFKRALFANSEFSISLGGEHLDADMCALLGSIKEPYLSQILDGQTVEVPETGIDANQLYLDGMISAYCLGYVPTEQPKMNQTPDSLFTPVSGHTLRILGTTTTTIPVVKRVRKITFNQLAQRQPLSNLAHSTLIAELQALPKDGVIDSAWIAAEKIRATPNEFWQFIPGHSLTTTEDEVRNDYRYLYGNLACLSLQISFPSGQLSQSICIYKATQASSTPLDFDKLPLEIQAAMLSNTKVSGN